jgi:hypothetical protein
MKTTILGMTTAIALAIPAVGYANIEDTVVNVLERQGYEATSIDMLSEGQIAQIYITSTSEDESALQRVLDGYDLSGGDMNSAETGPSGVEMTVARELEINGYPGDMVSALSSGDIANIYAASTSGSETDIDGAIDEAIETSSRAASDDPSAAEDRARRYLARQGVSEQQIDAVAPTDLVSIYVALTSGNRTDINRAVTSALES